LALLREPLLNKRQVLVIHPMHGDRGLVGFHPALDRGRNLPSGIRPGEPEEEDRPVGTEQGEELFVRLDTRELAHGGIPFSFSAGQLSNPSRHPPSITEPFWRPETRPRSAPMKPTARDP